MKRFVLLSSIALLSGMMFCSCGVKVDHDSPEGVVKSYVEAENSGDADAMVECLDLSDYEGKDLEKIRTKAKEVAQWSKGQYKSFSVRKESGGWVIYDYVSSDGANGGGSLQVEKVDGKWYVTVHSTGLMY